MPAIILLAVWKNFGYNMLIFIAGLQSIPEELYEAAQLDGAGCVAAASATSRCRCSAPTFLFVGVITMIGYFQLFAEPYVMTQGGPLQQHDQPRAAHVRGGLPLVAHGLRGGDRVRAVRDHAGRHAAPAPARSGSAR